MLTAMLLVLALSIPDTEPQLSETELKKLFLACDAASQSGLVDDADAAACSVIYEALKDRVFGGDSRRLLEWWRQEKSKRRNEAGVPAQ